MDEDPSPTSQSENRFRFGPGLLVAAAFIGPGTVVTASKAGAQFGCELLWTIVFASFGAIVLQNFAARLGIISGMGLGEYLRTWLADSFWFRWVVVLVIAAICGVLGWSQQEQRWRFLPIAYAVVCIGAALAIFNGKAPSETILLAQFANGILPPIIATILLWTAVKQSGEFAPTRWEFVLGCGIVLFVGLLAAWKIVLIFR